MTVDDILHILAPLTPAVLPVLVAVWYRTRQELRGIRRELEELRERSAAPDQRLDELIEAVDAMRATLARIADADRLALSPPSERGTGRSDSEAQRSAEGG